MMKKYFALMIVILLCINVYGLTKKKRSIINGDYQECLTETEWGVYWAGFPIPLPIPYSYEVITCSPC